ncbi:RICIN domain-containing protein [Cystobacter fuscus]
MLGIRDASTAAGALALQWGDTLTRDHLWSIVDMGNGYSKLVNAHSGMVLGIRDASRSVGAPALQWHDTGTDDHRWRIETAAPSSVAP